MRRTGRDPCLNWMVRCARGTVLISALAPHDSVTMAQDEGKEQKLKPCRQRKVESPIARNFPSAWLRATQPLIIASLIKVDAQFGGGFSPGEQG